MVERFEKFTIGISEISKYWHRIASEEMEKYGLKSAHSLYLVTIFRYKDGITAAKLGDVCGKDKADVSRAMSELEKKELITKEGNNYRALLKLTDAGKKAAEFVREKARLAVEFAGNNISKENREIFYDVLYHISENLQILSEKGLPIH